MEAILEETFMKKFMALIMLFLSSCGVTSPATNNTFNTSALAKDISIIALGIEPLIPVISTYTKTDPNTTAKLETLLKEIQTNAASVASSTSQAGAQPYAQAVVTAVNAVVGIAATLPLPATYKSILQAATVLMPVVETELGLLKVTRPTVKLSLPAVEMTPEFARVVLKGAAKVCQ
jgi:hypothetical protein